MGILSPVGSFFADGITPEVWLMGLFFGCEAGGMGLLAAERCNYCIFMCFAEEIPARIEALTKTRAGCQSWIGQGR
jgi:hypothetical protein